MKGRGGVVGLRAASDWLDCEPQVVARAPPGPPPTLRFLSDLTGRPAWGGPVLVLMFDPAPT